MHRTISHNVQKNVFCRLERYFYYLIYTSVNCTITFNHLNIFLHFVVHLSLGLSILSSSCIYYSTSHTLLFANLAQRRRYNFLSTARVFVTLEIELTFVINIIGQRNTNFKIIYLSGQLKNLNNKG